MFICDRLKKGETELAVVGLGYVGLPLALAFAKVVKVIGFDIDEKKITSYQSGIDPTMGVENESLRQSTAVFTSDETALRRAQYIVVAVPTPVDDNLLPDLRCVISASEVVGRNLSKGAIVVFESTVYAGVTEDICVPTIEKTSGLKCGTDFMIGYSPERINPGDKVHRLDNITKIVAGMNDETTDEMAKIYGLVVTAGTYKAKSIKVAELAKLVENTQRDVNIAFMNELSILLHRFNIDTMDVLSAMKTKWNALDFTPGLVGGHCIGVDPYYLIHHSERVGYRSQVLRAARYVNDGMAAFVADSALNLMIRYDQPVKRFRVYILGMTYKENCPDIRNSMSFKIADRLMGYGVLPGIVDPVADKADIKACCGLDVVDLNDVRDADCLIFAVSHRRFTEIGAEGLRRLFAHDTERRGVVLDVKNIFSRDEIERNGYVYWNL